MISTSTMVYGGTINEKEINMYCTQKKFYFPTLLIIAIIGFSPSKTSAPLPSMGQDSAEIDMLASAYSSTDLFDGIEEATRRLPQTNILLPFCDPDLEGYPSLSPQVRNFLEAQTQVCDQHHKYLSSSMIRELFSTPELLAKVREIIVESTEVDTFLDPEYRIELFTNLTSLTLMSCTLKHEHCIQFAQTAIKQITFFSCTMPFISALLPLSLETVSFECCFSLKMLPICVLALPHVTQLNLKGTPVPASSENIHNTSGDIIAVEWNRAYPVAVDF